MIKFVLTVFQGAAATWAIGAFIISFVFKVSFALIGGKIALVIGALLAVGLLVTAIIDLLTRPKFALPESIERLFPRKNVI